MMNIEIWFFVEMVSQPQLVLGNQFIGEVAGPATVALFVGRQLFVVFDDNCVQELGVDGPVLGDDIFDDLCNFVRSVGLKLQRQRDA